MNQEIQMIKQLADNGDAKAQEMLGQIYYQGTDSVSTDQKKAEYYFKLAADQGLAKSQYMTWALIDEHNKGKYFNEDSLEFQYLLKAAEQKYPKAVLLLAYAYSVGKMNLGTDYANWEVKKNEEKAKSLLRSIQYESLDSQGKQLMTALKRDLKISTSSQTTTSEGCYIATAVYGDYDAEEVLVLRKYRDEILLKHWWGKIFVKIYYFCSPTLAKRLKRMEKLNKEVRKVLDRIVLNIKSKDYK